MKQSNSQYKKYSLSLLLIILQIFQARSQVNSKYKYGFYVKSFHEGLARIEKEGKVGFIDTLGNYVIPLGKYGIIDEYFSNGLAAFKYLYAIGGLYGYIDKNGNVKIQPQYSEAWSFESLTTPVLDYKTHRWGFIDTSGKVTIPFIYTSVSYFREGLALASKDINPRERKLGYINESGKLVIPYTYNWGGPFTSGFAKVHETGPGMMYINKSGTKVYIDTSYNQITGFYNGLSLVKVNNKFGFMDTNFRIVIEPKYERVYDFKDNFARVKLNGKVAFIDTKGNIINEHFYEDASDFNDGLAAVQENNKWGCINANGEIIIPFQYDFIWEFSEGFGLVQNNGQIFFIDKKNNCRILCH